MISWKASKRDFETLSLIADRAVGVARRGGLDYSRQSAIMDLTAAHANGCPLRLDDLLAAPDFDFSHDVIGIRRHLDRDTGKLLNCFTPRYAARG